MTTATQGMARLGEPKEASEQARKARDLIAAALASPAPLGSETRATFLSAVLPLSEWELRSLRNELRPQSPLTERELQELFSELRLQPDGAAEQSGLATLLYLVDLAYGHNYNNHRWDTSCAHEAEQLLSC